MAISHEHALAALEQNISHVFKGNDLAVRLLLAALFCDGHVLLEDVPGVGKTVLAKALAKSLDADFKRVQFTPDLLPADITGTYIYNQKTGDFEFRHGPVFTNILLADEINRATPRTQSALLEAMEEKQVSSEGITLSLPMPFMVLATQNPMEQQGTFPLPEAQLDRFLIRLSLGYPNWESEWAVLEGQRERHPLEDIGAVVNIETIMAIRDELRHIHVDDSIKRYVLQIVRATREDDSLRWGASPRGALALLRAASAFSYLERRDYVSPESVKIAAPYVLGHRIILDPQARLKGKTAEGIIAEILSSIELPVEVVR